MKPQDAIICVTHAFCSTDHEKRETARSLLNKLQTALLVPYKPYFLNPCRFLRDVLRLTFFSAKTFLKARSEERRLYLQATTVEVGGAVCSGDLSKVGQKIQE